MTMRTFNADAFHRNNFGKFITTPGATRRKTTECFLQIVFYEKKDLQIMFS